EAGQLQVEEHEVPAADARAAHRLAAVADRLHGPAVRRQVVLQQLDDVGVVLHHQGAGHACIIPCLLYPARPCTTDGERRRSWRVPLSWAAAAVALPCPPAPFPRPRPRPPRGPTSWCSSPTTSTSPPPSSSPTWPR